MKKQLLTLLVSRFNCPHPVWDNKTSEEYKKWLWTRLDLFSRYTLNSYKNLNTKPDQWILLVDKEKFDQKIFNKLSNLIQGEKCQLVQFRSGIRQSILDYLIHKYGIENFPNEIRTTRLDTDDLIAKNFFDQINSIVLENNNSQMLISFPGGANYDVESDSFYYSSYPNNPFLTLCEKISHPNAFKSVYSQMHTEFYKFAEKNLYIRSFSPMWGSIIHKNNLANESLKKTNQVTLAPKERMKSIFGITTIKKEQPNMEYKEFLSKIHDELQPKNYVEIGIREGKTLALAKGISIGIDPNFQVNVETQSFVKLFRSTSDDFFNKKNLKVELVNQSCQLAFIDGLHLFEYTLRDFLNLEAYCESQSVVIFDDVRPRTPQEAQRKRTGGSWTGDIWKIYYCLQKYRPDLELSLIQTQPTGLLLVTNLDPENQILWKFYNNIIEEFLSPNFPKYPNNDYFDLFNSPNEFLESEYFDNIKTWFDQNFNKNQNLQEKNKILDRYRTQLRNVVAASEELKRMLY